MDHDPQDDAAAATAKSPPASPGGAAAAASASSPRQAAAAGRQELDFDDDALLGKSSEEEDSASDEDEEDGMVHHTWHEHHVMNQCAQMEVDPSSSMMPSSVVNRLHWGLDPASTKFKVGRILESQAIEALVLLLVLCDLALVSVECGIYHHIICINGRLVPKASLENAGDADFGHEPQHFLVQGPELPKTAWETPGQLPQIHKASSSLEERVRSASAVLLQVGQRTMDAALGAAVPLLGGALHGNPLGELISGAAVGGLDVSASGSAAAAVLAAITAPDGWRVAAANPSELEALRGVFLAQLRGYSQYYPKDDPHLDVVLLCEERTSHTAHSIVLWCDILSIGILMLFLLELLAKMWVHPAFFRRSLLHCLDLTVVAMSLVADALGMVLYYYEFEVDVKLVEMLLVTIRLWRVLRIFHTAFSMWYHATAPLKERVRLQKELLANTKEKITLLRSLAGVPKATEEEIREMVVKMREGKAEASRKITKSSATSSVKVPPAG